MPRPRVIDHQAHWYTPARLDQVTGREDFPRARRDEEGGYLYEEAPGEVSRLSPRFFDLDLQLAAMDGFDIDHAVISPNLLGEVTWMPVEEATAVTELINEETARAQREHPDRLTGLAMLPMQDGEAALGALDRAIGELDLRGVCVLSNIAGRPIVNDDTRAVFARVAELDVPLFLHPSHRSMAHPAGIGETIDLGLGWMFDTAAAALALVYEGVLDQNPSLTVVHPHLGGVLPYVTGRVAPIGAGAPIEHDLHHYLRTNFIVDSTGKTPGALQMAARTYGEDRIVFATDNPWVNGPGTLGLMRTDGDEELVHRVLRVNRVPNLRLAG
ncbi:MAG: amidohydrolase family protein [Solirubrobacterales bacterium]